MQHGSGSEPSREDSLQRCDFRLPYGNTNIHRVALRRDDLLMAMFLPADWLTPTGTAACDLKIITRPDAMRAAACVSVLRWMVEIAATAVQNGNAPRYHTYVETVTTGRATAVTPDQVVGYMFWVVAHGIPCTRPLIVARSLLHSGTSRWWHLAEELTNKQAKRNRADQQRQQLDRIQGRTEQQQRQFEKLTLEAGALEAAVKRVDTKWLAKKSTPAIAQRLDEDTAAAQLLQVVTATFDANGIELDSPQVAMGGNVQARGQTSQAQRLKATVERRADTGAAVYYESLRVAQFRDVLCEAAMAMLGEHEGIAVMGRMPHQQACTGADTDGGHTQDQFDADEEARVLCDEAEAAEQRRLQDLQRRAARVQPAVGAPVLQPQQQQPDMAVVADAMHMDADDSDADDDDELHVQLEHVYDGDDSNSNSGSGGGIRTLLGYSQSESEQEQDQQDQQDQQIRRPRQRARHDGAGDRVVVAVNAGQEDAMDADDAVLAPIEDARNQPDNDMDPLGYLLHVETALRVLRRYAGTQLDQHTVAARIERLDRFGTRRLVFPVPAYAVCVGGDTPLHLLLLRRVPSVYHVETGRQLGQGAIRAAAAAVQERMRLYRQGQPQPAGGAGIVDADANPELLLLRSDVVCNAVRRDGPQPPQLITQVSVSRAVYDYICAEECKLQTEGSATTPAALLKRLYNCAGMLEMVSGPMARLSPALRAYMSVLQTACEDRGIIGDGGDGLPDVLLSVPVPQHVDPLQLSSHELLYVMHYLSCIAGGSIHTHGIELWAYVSTLTAGLHRIIRDILVLEGAQGTGKSVVLDVTKRKMPPGAHVTASSNTAIGLGDRNPNVTRIIDEMGAAFADPDSADARKEMVQLMLLHFREMVTAEVVTRQVSSTSATGERSTVAISLSGVQTWLAATNICTKPPVSPMGAAVHERQHRVVVPAMTAKQMPMVTRRAAGGTMVGGGGDGVWSALWRRIGSLAMQFNLSLTTGTPLPTMTAARCITGVFLQGLLDMFGIVPYPRQVPRHAVRALEMCVLRNAVHAAVRPGDPLLTAAYEAQLLRGDDTAHAAAAMRMVELLCTGGNVHAQHAMASRVTAMDSIRAYRRASMHDLQAFDVMMHGLQLVVQTDDVVDALLEYHHGLAPPWFWVEMFRATADRLVKDRGSAVVVAGDYYEIPLPQEHINMRRPVIDYVQREMRKDHGKDVIDHAAERVLRYLSQRHRSMRTLHPETPRIIDINTSAMNAAQARLRGSVSMHAATIDGGRAQPIAQAECFDGPRLVRDDAEVARILAEYEARRARYFMATDGTLDRALSQWRARGGALPAVPQIPQLLIVAEDVLVHYTDTRLRVSKFVLSHGVPDPAVVAVLHAMPVHLRWPRRISVTYLGPLHLEAWEWGRHAAWMEEFARRKLIPPKPAGAAFAALCAQYAAADGYAKAHAEMMNQGWKPRYIDWRQGTATYMHSVAPRSAFQAHRGGRRTSLGVDMSPDDHVPVYTPTMYVPAAGVAPVGRYTIGCDIDEMAAVERLRTGYGVSPTPELMLALLHGIDTDTRRITRAGPTAAWTPESEVWRVLAVAVPDEDAPITGSITATSLYSMDAVTPLVPPPEAPLAAPARAIEVPALGSPSSSSVELENSMSGMELDDASRSQHVDMYGGDDDVFLLSQE